MMCGDRAGERRGGGQLPFRVLSPRAAAQQTRLPVGLRALPVPLRLTVTAMVVRQRQRAGPHGSLEPPVVIESSILTTSTRGLGSMYMHTYCSSGTISCEVREWIGRGARARMPRVADTVGPLWQKNPQIFTSKKKKHAERQPLPVPLHAGGHAWPLDPESDNEVSPAPHPHQSPSMQPWSLPPT